MKTSTTMKNFDVLTYLSQMGIVWRYLVNGLIGGLVWSIYKKSKFWEAIRQVFIGGIVSAYATPFIAEKTSLASAGFVSFVTGMIGMVVIEVVYKWAVTKLKLMFS